MDNIGTRIDFEVFARKIKERGKPSAHKVTITDVTELLKAAENLREPDKLTTAYILSGDFHLDHGDFNAAKEAAYNAMSYAAQTGEERFICAALNLKGNVEFRCGEYDKSERTLKNALENAQQSGATGELMEINSSLGVLKARIGEYGEAEKYFHEAFTIALAVGFRKKQVDLHVNLGNVYYCQGDINKAISTFEEARVKAEYIGYLNPVGRILNGLGTIYQTVGLYDEAKRMYEEAVGYYRRFDNPTAEGIGYINLASTHIEMEKPDEAEEYCEPALDIFKPGSLSSDPTYFFYATILSSDIPFLRGDYDVSEEWVDKASRIVSEIGLAIGEGRVLYRRARIDLKRGLAEEAYRKITDAISIAEDTKGEFTFHYRFVLYESLKAMGDIENAREALERAYSYLTGFYDGVPEGELRWAFVKRPDYARIIEAAREEGIEDTVFQ